MPVFSLFEIPSHLLEQILTKVKWQSYFRMMRTCKYIYESVKDNPRINVYNDDDCQPGVTATTLQSSMYGSINLDCDVVCGMRFQELKLSSEPEEDLQFCEYLKGKRVSYRSLVVKENCCWTSEHYSRLFSLLKPKWFEVDCRGIGWLEPLVHFGLDDADIVLSSINEDTLHIMQTLVPRLKYVTIEINEKYSSFDHLLNYYKKILQFLISGQFPPLQSFTFWVHRREDILPLASKLEAKLQDFIPTIRSRERAVLITMEEAFKGIPFTCQIEIHKICTTINYDRKCN